jgi:hypothetical protein
MWRWYLHVFRFLYIPRSVFLVSVCLLRDAMEIHYAHVVSYYCCCFTLLHLLYCTHFIGIVCLPGDTVCTLVFEHLYVFVVVHVGMHLVKEFYT